MYLYTSIAVKIHKLPVENCTPATWLIYVSSAIILKIIGFSKNTNNRHILLKQLTTHLMFHLSSGRDLAQSLSISSVLPSILQLSIHLQVLHQYSPW